jgi:hypothetical protein
MAAGDTTGFADLGSAIPKDAGVRIFPVDGQGFVHLQVLACFNASPAKNALVWVVAVKGIRQIYFIRLGLVGDFLVFDRKKSRRIVNRAVAVAVVADRAIQEMIAQYAVKCLALRSARARRRGDDINAIRGQRAASPGQFAIHLDHTSVAGLNRSKLGVVTNLGYSRTRPVENIDQPFPGLDLKVFPVYANSHENPTLQEECWRY